MTLKLPFTNGKVHGDNIDSEDYISNDVPRGDAKYVMSRSDLVEFNRCPQRWIKGYKMPESDAKDWGNIIDCLILTPDKFADRYVVAPSTYPAKGKKKDDPEIQKPWSRNATFCKEWEEEQSPRIVLKSEEEADARRAATVLRSDKTIAAFLACSRKQVMITADYTDADTNLAIPVKILIDLVPEPDPRIETFGTDGLGDLKTTECAAADPWIRSVFNYHYHVQAALQLDVFNAVYGLNHPDYIPRETFYHILQESYHPFQPAKRILTGEFIELGRLFYRRAIARYAQCHKTQVWPDYDMDALRPVSKAGNSSRQKNSWSETFDL